MRIASINKTKKISYLIFKYSFNFWDCFLIIIFLIKIKTEKNKIILIKNIIEFLKNELNLNYEIIIYV